VSKPEQCSRTPGRCYTKQRNERHANDAIRNRIFAPALEHGYHSNHEHEYRNPANHF
jgi:hypothetical protein